MTRDEPGSLAGMLTRNRAPSGDTSYTCFAGASRAAGVSPIVNRRVGRPAMKRRARLDLHRHHRTVVGGRIEQLASVAAPPRRGASADRDALSLTGLLHGRDVDFRRADSVETNATHRESGENPAPHSSNRSFAKGCGFRSPAPASARGPCPFVCVFLM